MKCPNTTRLSAYLVIAGAALVLSAVAMRAMIYDMGMVRTLHEPNAEHTSQLDLLNLVKGGQNDEAVEAAFEAGDEFFETEFNALDGVGANVGDGSRFTHVPRADLTGPGQWAQHQPPRATGPNAISCNACHIQLFDDGGGSVVANVHRDPLHTGNVKQFIQRNTPHVFALGATQRLAEEMTLQLEKQRKAIAAQACSFGSSSGTLQAKGISYGTLRATRGRSVAANDPLQAGLTCAVIFDTSSVKGIAADLVVRPFQWKGNKATVRDFNRGAAHDELGMQAVELVGEGVDGDGDRVVNEVSVGDITALSVYLASQPRPTTKMELAALSLIDPLTDNESLRIRGGALVFNRIGCQTCHVQRLLLDDPTFSEPSQVAAYRDGRFPAGQDPVALGVDPNFAIKVDLTKDQPDNQVHYSDGTVYRLGSLTKDSNGKAVVELFGDLKQHDMGPGLAEAIDEAGNGRAMFLTRNLWGVGSSAPYLHDGRATTLTEAILEHGGEAQSSRNQFVNLSRIEQRALISFLNNLVLFKMEDGEVVIPPPPTVRLNSALRIASRLKRIRQAPDTDQ
jgi:di-heme oxidoreductase (putative peroxidase)